MAEFQKKQLPEEEKDAWDEILKVSEVITPSDRECPVCGKGKLQYDHFLNLTCPKCGFVEASCFT